MTVSSSQRNPDSPFALESATAYRAWRAAKLGEYPARVEQLMVDIQDPRQLRASEKSALLANLAKTNIAFYRIRGELADKHAIRQLGQQLGLLRLDGNLCADADSITSLRVMNQGRQRGYIPYTNKPLSWHTDGYYNAQDQQIRAILMHCVTPAQRGGENALLDHERLYIDLRDRDPALIAALMHPQAMTIPANIEAGEELRAETVGPVYSIAADGHLHMRYSARTRNIHWRDDALTLQAVSHINEILSSDNANIFRYTLQANEGVISNNALHNRTGFDDSSEQQRLLYRARYYDRVAQT